MQCVEVLTGERRSEQTAQGFAPAPLGTHRCSQGMHLAEATSEAREAAFVSRAGPRLAVGLRREGPNGSLVFEAVAMLVRALAAGVVAIQAGPPRTANDGELGGAPGTGPVGGARMGDDWHSNVVRRGCDTVCRGAPGPRRPPPAPAPSPAPSPTPSPEPAGASTPRRSSVTKPSAKILRPVANRP